MRNRVLSFTLKGLYAFAFVGVLPAILLLWADCIVTGHQLPAVHSPVAGWAMAIVGVSLMMWATGMLRVYGRGLPMAAFPPLHLVSLSVYRFLPHPIYIGFCLTIAGWFIATGSATGLWIVTPILILGCVALVVGFERDDIRRRFGRIVRAEWFHLPDSSDQLPTSVDRVSAMVVLFMWVVLYEAVVLLGVPSDALSLTLSLENRIPVIEWTEFFYSLTYPWVALVPIIANRQSRLREFMIRGLLSLAVVIPVYLIIPVQAAPRAFTPETIWGQWILMERQLDTAVAAFPSYHVIWVILASAEWSQRFRRLRWMSYLSAAMISLSCVLVGAHSLADILSGGLVGMALIHWRAIWARMRRTTEAVANGWTEWRWGGVRLIHHGLYAGVGALLGYAFMSVFAPPSMLGPLMFLSVCCVLGAAVWAQWLEGSSALLRPFGYYGSVIGVMLGSVCLYAVDVDGLYAFALFCLSAPIVQFWGRMRCLTQGCCHGRRCAEDVGIRYTHPQSRVARLAGLGHEPLHPTPLYSMIGNVYVFGILVRLWTLEVPASAIIGFYFIFSGLFRFVEEGYRGEPQTKIVWRMRLYQWMAIVTVLIGIALTMFPSSAVVLEVSLSADEILTALIAGLLTTAAYGLDFPNSSRRFSRLT